MTEYVQPVSYAFLVILCFSLVRMMNGRLKNKVTRGECHQAQNSIKDKIDDLDKNINRRFDDLKDFIKDNGTK